MQETFAPVRHGRGAHRGRVAVMRQQEFEFRLSLDQLAPGGRLIMPVGAPGRQDLLMVTRRNGVYEEASLGAVSFVPLVKGLQV